MANLTVTVPDGQVQRVLDAFGYSATIPNPDYDPNADPPDTDPTTIPNPQTGAQFLRSRLVDHVKRIVREHEWNVAARTAADGVTEVSAS